MKRNIIIVGGVALLILLIVRMVFVSIDRANDARHEFVARLNYELSAQVDSVGLFNKAANVGFIYIKLTGGDYDNREKKIARSIKRGKTLRFLTSFDSIRFEIFSQHATDYKVGDSLVINTKEDKLIVFRASEKIKEFSISEDLRGGDE